MDKIPLCAVDDRAGRYFMHALGWTEFVKFWDIDPDQIRAAVQSRYRRAK